MRLPAAVAFWVAAMARAAFADADPRGPAAFDQWAAARPADVAAFSQYLHAEEVGAVVPLWQLLRTASDWQRCAAQPFALAPREQWPAAASTLRLLKQLREARVLGEFEAVSSWRGEALNRCAGGSARSAHVRSFAVDFLPGAPVQGVCEFWKHRGRAWNMGLSRYPSGRIHVDTAGYRTLSEDYTQRSSFCQ